ncbi:hypothetical protein [Flavobacterium sp. F52]|uniref:hypothetical protein n=1 Tax=Flavobacterium sp. F52 TaxID=1202532 RepID=UPI000272E7D6|nr:hypothetical protein [Flavobacterium sp. F52]EJG00489.1 hypothetical protein FF52_15184 [Flavobacterium sp. F52]
MKNLNNYLRINFLLVILGIILFSCSNEETLTPNNSNLENKTSTISNKTGKTAAVASGAITCYISGSSVFNVNTNNAYSVVNPNSSATYQYNSSTSVNSITWSIVAGSVVPAGSLSITGNGVAATITTSSTFSSGSIQALGTDSSGQLCGPVIPIVKSSGSGSSCCTPILSASYICRGSGSGSAGGAVDISIPAGCNIDWATISKIDVSLSNGTRFTTTSPSSLYNQSQGTLIAPYNLNNNKIRLSFTNSECMPDIACTATFYFSNGCPTVTATVVTLGPLETSE